MCDVRSRYGGCPYLQLNPNIWSVVQALQLGLQKFAGQNLAELIYLQHECTIVLTKSYEIQNLDAVLYPDVCFMGEYETVRGPSSGRRSRVEARSAEQGGVWGGGVSLPRVWGPVVSPRENFDAIWCNLVHFGKKFTFLQISKYVNENIAIVLDSGIDIVTYYFNF